MIEETQQEQQDLISCGACKKKIIKSFDSLRVSHCDWGEDEDTYEIVKTCSVECSIATIKRFLNDSDYNLWDSDINYQQFRFYRELFLFAFPEFKLNNYDERGSNFDYRETKISKCDICNKPTDIFYDDVLAESEDGTLKGLPTCSFDCNLKAIQNFIDEGNNKEINEINTKVFEYILEKINNKEERK